MSLCCGVGKSDFVGVLSKVVPVLPVGWLMSTLLLAAVNALAVQL